jgi:hypothetical protein
MNYRLVRLTSGAVYFTLCVALHSFALVASANELTADEILQRSKDAMQPPIRYRTISQGGSTLVFQKMLSDGSMATRREQSSPVPKISLIVGKSVSEFYLDHGVGIDMSNMINSVASQATAMSLNPGAPAAGTLKVRTVSNEDGRECFEVTRFHPPHLIAAVSNGLPEAVKKRIEARIPMETRTLIDRKTFEMVETRTVSQTGSTISLSEYREIEQPVELSDDLFLPPDGLELLKPEGPQEYIRMLRDILSTNFVQPQIRQRPEIMRPKPLLVLPPRMGRPKIDPRTGRIIPRQPLRARRGELHRLPAPQRSPTANLTAEEVLARSSAAMKPPIRYNVVCNGVGSIVSQKVAFDGLTRRRVWKPSRPCPRFASLPALQAARSILTAVWDLTPPLSTALLPAGVPLFPGRLAVRR